VLHFWAAARRTFQPAFTIKNKNMKTTKWIWCAQNNPRDYNQTVHFKKEFTVRDPANARLQITADSWYRVSVNGKWINDGPARAYPDHWQYDEHDLASTLRPGKIVPRNTALLTKTPRRPKGPPSVTSVRKPTPQWAVPATQLCQPDLIEANLHTSRPLILRGTLSLSKKQSLNFSSKDLCMFFFNRFCNPLFNRS